MPADLPPLSLDDVTQTAENPFTTVNTLLSDFNAGHVGPTTHVPLWLLARDPNGKVQGAFSATGVRPRRVNGVAAANRSAVSRPWGIGRL